MFDLAVNGGGRLTLNYTRIGYLSAQRAIDVPWLDYVQLPDVVLLQEDPHSSLIDLAAAIPMQVARGSVISDSSGVRQQTLFFPQGTTAYMSFTNGVTQTITTMHVRATEYTVGPTGVQAMPAELPPNSAYTYASIFHADEAVAAVPRMCGSTRRSFRMSRTSSPSLSASRCRWAIMILARACGSPRTADV